MVGGPSFLGPVKSHKGLKSDLWASIIRPRLASGVWGVLSGLSTHYVAGTMLSPLHPCSDPHCKPLAEALASPFCNKETEAQEGPCLRSLSWEGIEAGLKPRPWQLQPPEGNRQAKATPPVRSNGGFPLNRREEACSGLFGTDLSHRPSLCLECPLLRSACVWPLPLHWVSV